MKHNEKSIIIKKNKIYGKNNFINYMKKKMEVKKMIIKIVKNIWIKNLIKFSK